MDAGEGFRRMEGGDRHADARLVTAAHLHELRHAPFATLTARAGAQEVEGRSGGRLWRRTRITADRDELRIRIRVDDGRLAGRADPLAEELVRATPDSESLRGWTLAGEASDPRRYAAITPALQLAGIAVAVLASWRSCERRAAPR